MSYKQDTLRLINEAHRKIGPYNPRDTFSQMTKKIQQRNVLAINARQFGFKFNRKTNQYE